MSASHFTYNISLTAADLDRIRADALASIEDGAIITLPPATPLNSLAWQPMDTAPTGERVLVWLDGGEGKRGIREGFLVDAERGEWCYLNFCAGDDDMCGCNGDPDPVAWAHKPAGPSWGGAV